MSAPEGGATSRPPGSGSAAGPSSPATPITSDDREPRCAYRELREAQRSPGHGRRGLRLRRRAPGRSATSAPRVWRAWPNPSRRIWRRWRQP